MNAPATSSDVLKWLERRYAQPEWRLFAELRNGTGWARDSGIADAIAMNMWPSGGYAIHGIEIKVSRGDWLREAKNEKKNDGVRRYCDAWYIAVPDDTIVKAGELPQGWGLLRVSEDATRTIVKAAALDPVPMDRGLAAVLIRAASDAQERDERQAQKALILKAPLRPVSGFADGVFVLSCGHRVARPRGFRTPKTVRCIECSGSNERGQDGSEK